MKNGLFKLLFVFAASLAVTQFSSCAALFEEGYQEDGVGYDRGYQANAPEEDEDAECSGRYCNSGQLADVDSPMQYESRRANRAIESRDVVLGMTRQQVMSSWGEPQQREAAGARAAGHERWTYGSRYSLNGSRVVIFENGRVAGWRR